MQFPDKLRAALIDMDGVLFNSMPRHARAWQQMMAEAGVETTVDEFFLYEGMTGPATIDLIFERELGRKADPEEARRLYARKADLFVAQGYVEPIEGASEMLRTLKDAGVDCVLVTGSAQKTLLERLQRDFPGIFSADKMVTALDVVKGKPDPEPYLKGLALAGTRPEETIVIENAPLGVRAGVASGCFTAAVTTGPVPREAFERENASAIFASMPEFTEYLRNLL